MNIMTYDEALQIAQQHFPEIDFSEFGRLVVFSYHH